MVKNIAITFAVFSAAGLAGYFVGGLFDHRGWGLFIAGVTGALTQLPMVVAAYLDV